MNQRLGVVSHKIFADLSYSSDVYGMFADLTTAKMCSSMIIHVPLSSITPILVRHACILGFTG